MRCVAPRQSLTLSRVARNGHAIQQSAEDADAIKDLYTVKIDLKLSKYFFLEIGELLSKYWPIY